MPWIGLPAVCAARYLAIRQTATIGLVLARLDANAMAQAIGAEATFPGRPVIRPCGRELTSRPEHAIGILAIPPERSP